MFKLEVQKDGFNRIFTLYKGDEVINRYYENSYNSYQYSIDDYVEGVIFDKVDKIKSISRVGHNKCYTVLKVPINTEVPENLIIYTKDMLRKEGFLK